jgi:hypothetical protein
MKFTQSLFALLTIMLLASALPMQASARAIVSPTPEPFTYLVSPDGHRTHVYLMQDDPRIIEMALAQGIVTQGDVVKSQQFLEMHRANVAPSGPMISDNPTEGSPWRPWGGTAATIISEGWDSDGD